MSQTLVTKIFKNTGDIGLPTNMLAQRLKTSFVAKSIIFTFNAKTASHFDAVAPLHVTIYFIYVVMGSLRWVGFICYVASNAPQQKQLSPSVRYHTDKQPEDVILTFLQTLLPVSS